MRALIIEDDLTLARTVELLLEKRGISSTVASTAKAGLTLADRGAFDVVLLDMLLPDSDGVEVIHRLRQSGSKIPIIVISGMSDTKYKVRAFNSGADDYIEKPIHADELVARLQAIARRERQIDEQLVEVGDMTINLARKSVNVAGVELDLTQKEYLIMEALALKRGTPVSKNALLSWLYRDVDEPVAKIIDVYICRLRKKIIEAASGASYIHTMRGEGYFIAKRSNSV